MNKLKKKFLCETIFCMSGYSNELDEKLKDVKTFKDLLRIEKKFSEKVSLENRIESIYNDNEILNISTLESDQKNQNIKYKILDESLAALDTMILSALFGLTKGISALVMGTGILTSAALGYGIFKLWQRFLSTEAKACPKLTDVDKSICMLNYRIEGIETVVNQLNEALSVCNKSENPGLCRYNIEKQIKVWILKLTDNRKQLAEFL